MKVQTEMAQEGEERAFDGELTLFTKPLADVKREFQEHREASGSGGSTRKCYDEAAPLADSAPDRFRLLAFRCAMLRFGMETSEAEADRVRKERAQRLYDENSLKGVVRTTLTQFLGAASTVDFAAQTTEKGGSRVFANPEYGKKDALWKQICRNGKEPTEVAVEFARAWLAELQPPAAPPASAKAIPAGGAKPAPAKAAARK